MDDKTPLTKDGEPSVEYVLANSTASSKMTAIGGASSISISPVAKVKMSRSSSAMRSIGQSIEKQLMSSSACASCSVVAAKSALVYPSGGARSSLTTTDTGRSLIAAS